MLVTLPPFFAQGNQPLWNESMVSELNLIYREMSGFEP